MKPGLRDELQASLIAALGLGLALLLAWTAHGLLSADGRAQRAAAGTQALPSDVVMVAHALGRDERDRGRILLPFRPHLALSDDGPAVDLESFPFARALLVGDAALPRGSRGVPIEHVGNAVVVALGDPARLLVAQVDYSGVAISRQGSAQLCSRRHASGGVACSAEPWAYVGPRSAQLDGVWRMCLWAHPPADNARLTIPLDLPQHLIREGSALRVQLNFLDEVRGEPAKPVVELELHGPSGQRAMGGCANRQGSCAVELLLEPGARQHHVIHIATAHNGRQLVCLSGGLMPAATQAGARP